MPDSLNVMDGSLNLHKVNAIMAIGSIDDKKMTFTKNNKSFLQIKVEILCFLICQLMMNFMTILCCRQNYEIIYFSEI